jgi:hypothetical protein
MPIGVEPCLKIIFRIKGNIMDDRAFGKIEAQVEALEKQVDSLSSKVDTLLELANKSKGGFWMGMTIASMLGAVVAWVIDHFLIK